MPEIQRRKQTWAGTTLNKAQNSVSSKEIAEQENEGYVIIKGTWQWGGFSGVLQKLIPHESLTLNFGPFRFWLQIRGDIRIRKTTPRYHRYGESPSPRITDTRSRRLPASPIWRAGYWIKNKKLSVSKIPRVVDSPHQWYGESPTPVSLSRRVADSAYRWVGSWRLPGSVIRRVAIKKKIYLVSIFRTFDG